MKFKAYKHNKETIGNYIQIDVLYIFLKFQIVYVFSVDDEKQTAPLPLPESQYMLPESTIIVTTTK